MLTQARLKKRTQAPTNKQNRIRKKTEKKFNEPVACSSDFPRNFWIAPTISPEAVNLMRLRARCNMDSSIELLATASKARSKLEARLDVSVWELRVPAIA